MRMIDPLLAEMEQEAGTTRRLLERVPEGKLSWRPHPKSYSLGQLALHVAGIPGGVSEMAMADNFSGRFEQLEPSNLSEILTTFDEGIAATKRRLAGLDDARAMGTWSFVRDGKPVFSLPRIAVLRTILLNHWYHHRGQLSVYLRQLDVPLPSVYGPSADENPFTGDM